VFQAWHPSSRVSTEISAKQINKSKTEFHSVEFLRAVICVNSALKKDYFESPDAQNEGKPNSKIGFNFNFGSGMEFYLLDRVSKKGGIFESFRVVS
jgi:hypothetical protein